MKIYNEGRATSLPVDAKASDNNGRPVACYARTPGCEVPGGESCWADGVRVRSFECGMNAHYIVCCICNFYTHATCCNL